jgi:hypothetical protein
MVLAAGASLAQREKELALVVLTVVLLSSSIILPAKLGSDLNYHLNLRIVQAIWTAYLINRFSRTSIELGHNQTPIERLNGTDNGSVAEAEGRNGAANQWTTGTAAPNVRVFLMTTIVLLAVLWSTRHALGMGAARSWLMLRRLESPAGLQAQSFMRQCCRLAQNPQVRTFTDNPLFALYQRDRAVLNDPFLFRMLVTTGRIEPTELLERLESESYDLLILTGNVFGEGYETTPFALAPPLAQSIRDHYRLRGAAFGFYLYGPLSTPRPDKES